MRDETITKFGKYFPPTSASIRPIMSIGREVLEARIGLPVKRAFLSNSTSLVKSIIPRNNSESCQFVTPEPQHDKCAIDRIENIENRPWAGKG